MTIINQGKSDGCLQLEAWLGNVGYRSVPCLAVCVVKGRPAAVFYLIIIQCS